VQQIRHASWHRGLVRDEHPVNLALIVQQHLLGERFVMHAAHALKHVTERPVPQVVHERRGQAKQLIFLGDVERASKLFDDPPGRLHHAEAMAVR